MPGIHISDYSPYYSQLALQGPRSLDTLKKLTKVDLAAIKNYWFTWGTVAGVPNVLIARTGYSGEDGFEVYIPSDEATTVKMWNALMEAGAEFGIRPCGLGARNTLRLEAGMSLYGHEISEEINVLEAGLTTGSSWTKVLLLAVMPWWLSTNPAARSAKSSAWKWSTAASPATAIRCSILGGREIGTITSGSPAPFLKTNIAMALVPAEYAASGRDVLVQVRRQPGESEAGAAALLQAGEEINDPLFTSSIFL